MSRYNFSSCTDWTENWNCFGPIGFRHFVNYCHESLLSVIMSKNWDNFIIFVINKYWLEKILTVPRLGQCKETTVSPCLIRIVITPVSQWGIEDGEEVVGSLHIFHCFVKPLNWDSERVGSTHFGQLIEFERQCIPFCKNVMIIKTLLLRKIYFCSIKGWQDSFPKLKGFGIKYLVFGQRMNG